MAAGGGAASPSEGLPSPSRALVALTLAAALFTLVTYARVVADSIVYPYLTLQNPSRVLFLFGERERYLEPWPHGPEAPLKASRAFNEILAEERLFLLDKGAEFDPAAGVQRLEELDAVGYVLGAGWGLPEARKNVSTRPEEDFPEYTRARVREIHAGDVEPDLVRAEAAARWDTMLATATFGIVVAGVVALGLGWWGRKRFFAEVATPALGIGWPQALVVFCWALASSATLFRVSETGDATTRDVIAATHSFALAAVTVALVTGTRWCTSERPLRALLAPPGSASEWIRLLLATTLGLGAALGGSLALGAIEDIAGLATNFGEIAVEELMYGSTWRAVATALALVVWAPVGEEILFRGVLFGALATRTSTQRAAVLSALAFAVWHGYGLAGTIEIGFFGYVMALLYARTRSLLPGIAVHAAINSLVAIDNLGFRILA